MQRNGGGSGLDMDTLLPPSADCGRYFAGHGVTLNPYELPTDVPHRCVGKRSILQFCFGSLTRVTTVGAILLYCLATFASQTAGSSSSGGRVSHRRTIGVSPRLVVTSGHEQDSRGEVRPLPTRISVEVDAAAALVLLGCSTLLSFTVALIGYPFWQRFIA
jgi:hypothetical protein